ncbi:hypothetical protein FRC12_003208 [Ceratobasidium sp. 428]|nr:hypothetical protein FRC12_003208 [Ceratobasidium sp. 428]
MICRAEVRCDRARCAAIINKPPSRFSEATLTPIPTLPPPSNTMAGSGPHDTITQTLSSPPSPMLEEILATYSAQVDGDKELLAAILRAKEAEDLRVAAMASLQQTIVQLQHALAQVGGIIPLDSPPQSRRSSVRERRRPKPRASSS